MPCTQKTGDPNLDDPTSRQNLEDAYASSPDDPSNPGLKDEVAGYCNTDGCSEHVGDVTGSSPGDRPAYATLEYHTHPSAGKSDPNDPEHPYDESPSPRDMRNARSPGREGLDSYVIGPRSIYRMSPDGNHTKLTCFWRWTNVAGCQP